MRYSIMLQLVTGTTLILIGAAALFAWVQNRNQPLELRRDDRAETTLLMTAKLRGA